MAETTTMDETKEESQQRQRQRHKDNWKLKAGTARVPRPRHFQFHWFWMCILFFAFGASVTTVHVRIPTATNTKTQTDRRPRSRSVVLAAADIPHTITIKTKAKSTTKTKNDKDNQYYKYDELEYHEQQDDADSVTSGIKRRLDGLSALLQKHPSLLISVTIRIIIANVLELALDGFLKAVVTPMVLATGIGALAAPLTFLLAYALQPIIHSIAFIVFDDRFLMTTLDATGIKHRLEKSATLTLNDDLQPSWHTMTFVEGFVTRYAIKSAAGTCLGWAGICTAVPVAGHVLTAILTGWIVAWDYVYVPLSGMGHIGPIRQFRTVWNNFWDYQWYGFWAVLAEEIPFLGPACHVYNVYSAAFFLERLYLPRGTNNNNNKHDDDDDDATVDTVDSKDSFDEL